MQQLLNHPSLGTNYAHVFPGYRRLQVEHHAVFYKVIEPELLVIRVLHEDMDAKASGLERGFSLLQCQNLPDSAYSCITTHHLHPAAASYRRHPVPPQSSASFSAWSPRDQSSAGCSGELPAAIFPLASTLGPAAAPPR